MTHPRFRIPWLSVDMAALRNSLIVVLFAGGSCNLSLSIACGPSEENY